MGKVLTESNSLRFEYNGKTCLVLETKMGFEASVLELKTLYKNYYKIIGMYQNRTEAVKALKGL